MHTTVGIPHLVRFEHELRKTVVPEVIVRPPVTAHRISLLMQGEGGGQTGPMRLSAKRPLAWFTPANDAETLQLHGQIDLWSFTFDWPDFEAAALQERELRLDCFGKSRQTHRSKPVDMSDASRMVEIFKSFQGAARRVQVTTELAGELEVRYFILLLIAFYTDLPEMPSASDVHRSLEQFRVLLDERAFDPVSINELAGQANMSPEYLRHLFFRRFGVQPHAYRATLRMNKARQLLADPNISVKEVAHLVGYDDPLYFSRVFKKRYGLKPSELIRQTRLPSPTPQPR